MLLCNPKTGEEYDSPMTDQEARERCKKGDDFARDLAAKPLNKLSPAQRFWLHKKAAPPKVTGIELPAGAHAKIIDVFDRAKSNGLKYPDLICRTPEGTVRWYLGRTGDVMVRCGQVTVGYITPQDRLVKKPYMKERTIKLCQTLCVDPLAACVLWGQQTSHCCFCRQPLETPESVSAGYGPVCADRWGLPWGHTGNTEVVTYDDQLEAAMEASELEPEEFGSLLYDATINKDAAARKRILGLPYGKLILKKG